MAMSQRGRTAAEWALQCHSTFVNSTGSFSGTCGPARKLGWLESHQDKARIKELLGRASYVVWSYDTPIGFVTEDETGNITRYYVDEHHTVTTSHHQGILRVAWGEYETIGEERRRPVRPNPRPAPRSVQEAVPGARMSFSGQDDLMDEAHSYTRPHP